MDSLCWNSRLLNALHSAMPLAGALAGLAAVSCEEPHPESSGAVYRPREPIPFTLPEKRVRTSNIRPETYRFLEAIRRMEEQIGALEESLGQVQELHESYDFDEFLGMDAATADSETLCYLAHFCDAGYFTVQRKVLLHLLEQRLERRDHDAWAALNSPGPKDLEQRLAEAMLFREEHIMDLEQVINLYETRQGAGEFYVPAYIPPEELETLRVEVAAKLDRERETVAGLDLEIKRLKGEAGVY